MRENHLANIYNPCTGEFKKVGRLEARKMVREGWIRSTKNQRVSSDSPSLTEIIRMFVVEPHKFTCMEDILIIKSNQLEETFPSLIDETVQSHFKRWLKTLPRKIYNDDEG